MEKNNRSVWRRLFGDTRSMIFTFVIIVLALGIYIVLVFLPARDAEPAIQPSVGEYYAINDLLPSKVVFIERLVKALPDAELIETETSIGTESRYTFSGGELCLYIGSNSMVHGFDYEVPIPEEDEELPTGLLGEEFVTDADENETEYTEVIRDTVIALASALDVSSTMTRADLATLQYELADFFASGSTGRTVKVAGYRLMILVLIDADDNSMFFSFTVAD